MRLSIEYDAEARAGYLKISGEGITRTVEVTEWLHLDLSSDGAIVGVESLTGPVNLIDVAIVLSELRWSR